MVMVLKAGRQRLADGLPAVVCLVEREEKKIERKRRKGTTHQGPDKQSTIST